MKVKSKSLSLIPLMFLLFSCDINWGSDSTIDPTTITLYAINDFHGSIVQKLSDGEMGLLNLGTYLKKQGEKENTLLINSGDMFQGSLESNYTKGRFLTDAMDIIGFDAFTLGNHEFDWGIENLASLRARNEYEYKTPWLSSNVYYWNDTYKTASDDRVENLGDLYSTQVLENGLKVGFIGAIGSSQWTSITSNYVKDITFLDPIEVIKDVSNTLKTKEKCDFVFLTYHGSQDELLNTGITDVSPISNKKYVDSVFCGHTHTNEYARENDVLFTQNSCNGKDISKIVLNINSDKTITSSVRSTINYYSVSNEIGTSCDSKLKACYDEYMKDVSTIGEEKLATLSGNFGSQFANVVADAMLEEAISEGYNPILAMTNKVRAYPEEGTMTYADLMKSVPFENTVVICKVKGSELLREASYSGIFIAKNSSFTGSIYSNYTYEVAIIDYLLYHMNINHEYNYFPSLKVTGKLEKDGETYGFRDVTAAYLREKKTISASSYSSSLDKFDASTL